MKEKEWKKQTHFLSSMYLMITINKKELLTLQVYLLSYLEVEKWKEGNPFEESFNNLLMFRGIVDYCTNLYVAMQDC